MVYPFSEWSKVTDATADSIQLRRVNRAVFAAAFSLKFDSQGRITLPLTLREYAGIRDQVVVAGANTYLELWNKEEWEAEKTASREQARQIKENMETQGEVRSGNTYSGTR